MQSHMFWKLAWILALRRCSAQCWGNINSCENLSPGIPFEHPARFIICNRVRTSTGAVKVCSQTSHYKNTNQLTPSQSSEEMFSALYNRGWDDRNNFRNEVVRSSALLDRFDSPGVLRGDGKSINTVTFNSDGCRLVTGDDDSMIKVFDYDTGGWSAEIMNEFHVFIISIERICR